MRRMFVNDEFKDIADARESRGMIGMVRRSSWHRCPCVLCLHQAVE